MFGIVLENWNIVVSKVKVCFEDAVAKLIVEQEGFVGIGIAFAGNSAESVGDIRRFVEPRVIEISV